MSFPDHFSPVARAYAAHRPRYPEELFDWLAGVTPSRELAWDCATGSGQAAVALARRFERVVATDASAEQISAATPDARVEYRVSPAEASGLAPASVDLVTVAQALHWFDRAAFYGEVRRVLRERGLLAVWTYGASLFGDPALDAIHRRFYVDVVGPCWPAERALVETGYATIDFPFEEIEPPSFAMEAEWPLESFLGYVGTWSAVSRFRRERGLDPVAPFAAELAARWGDPATARRIRWPLAVRVGRARP
jgi:SAM-dependent methyltransferase